MDITREFKFRHSPIRYKAIPIIAANMDTTGTFEIARALGRHDLSTALCKHYAVDAIVLALLRRVQELVVSVRRQQRWPVNSIPE